MEDGARLTVVHRAHYWVRAREERILIVSTITDAKRLIAVRSQEGARLLGMGMSGPCTPARYARAAAAALADPEAGLSREQRALIAEYIVPDDEPERRGRLLTVRMTEQELADFQTAAEAAGMSASEWVRSLIPPRLTAVRSEQDGDPTADA